MIPGDPQRISQSSFKGLVAMGEEKRRLSIFVVSDEGIPRQSLVYLLQSHPHYKIAGDCSVAEAESALWSPPPDLVLIHIGAAGVRVLGVIELLSARNIPVVLLLRNRTPWLVHAFHKAGALGMVLLESKSADLFGAIDAAASNRPFLDPLLSEALLGTTHGRSRVAPGSLSSREAQVLKYVAYGYSNTQIARKLKVSTKSVETYRSRVMDKLQLKDRTDLVRYALVTGVLAAEDIDEILAS